jgi:hypothetical protein
MAFSLTSGRPSLGGRSLAKAIATKEVYSFPILEADEIADVLREMGAAVTEEDFNKPKPDVFRQWCELFVIDILGINKDELYETHAGFAEALDGNEDLHEASVPIVHFIRNMCVARRGAAPSTLRRTPPRAHALTPPRPRARAHHPPSSRPGTRCSPRRGATRASRCAT